MPQTEWNEAELREVPIPAPVRRGQGLASNLRAELSHRNRTRASIKPHELTRGSTPAIIYAPDASTTATS